MLKVLMEKYVLCANVFTAVKLSTLQGLRKIKKIQYLESKTNSYSVSGWRLWTETLVCSLGTNTVVQLLFPTILYLKRKNNIMNCYKYDWFIWIVHNLLSKVHYVKRNGSDKYELWWKERTSKIKIYLFLIN